MSMELVVDSAGGRRAPPPRSLAAPSCASNRLALSNCAGLGCFKLFPHRS